VILGHDRTKKILEQSLPEVALLMGPRSTGKTTLCREAAKAAGILAADTVTHEKLNADAARDITRFLSTTPMGPAKCVIARLDSASESALNALLKTIEEPPARAHILLTTSSATMLTIQSRARLFPSGSLPPQILSEILRGKGMAPEEATRAAAMSNGTVASALAASASIEAARPPVLAALKATATGDEDLMANAMTKWGDAEGRLLATWAHEAATGRWSVFDGDSETFGLHASEVPRRIRASQALGARPKITARLALSASLEKRR
jgi:hypothetical protein